MAIFSPSDLSGGILSLYNQGVIPNGNTPQGMSFSSLLRSLFPPTSGAAPQQGPAPMTTAPALGAPINVPALPQGGAGIPQTQQPDSAALPPNAMPTGPARMAPQLPPD